MNEHAYMKCVHYYLHITGVEPNTNYEIRVLAGNSVGYPTGDANWVTYTTPVSTHNGKYRHGFPSAES